MNTLSQVTIGFGVLLVIVGVVSYAAASGDSRSITALIPAFIGLPLAVAGWATTRENLRRYAAWAAVLLVLALLLGSLRGVALLVGALTGDEDVTFPMVLQTVLVIVSAVYLGFSFVHVRQTTRSRRA